MKLKNKVFAGFLVGMLAVSSSAFAATDTNVVSVGIKSGTISIDYVETTPVSLGSITADGTTKTASAALEKVTVTDNMGTGNGWTVQLQASRFAEVDSDGAGPNTSSGKQLDAGSLTYKGVATALGITTKNTGDQVIDNGAAVTLAIADPGEGMGATDILHNNPGIVLSVNTSQPFVNASNLDGGGATPYESTLTWTVTAGP